jgi:hypothetical protein
MSHDPTKVLMGATQSAHREVTNYNGSREAGLILRLKNDGTLSITKADGELIGVSLGRDLSDIGRTSVCRKGLRVPVLLKSGYNPAVGAVVEVDDATGLATGDGTKTATAAYFATGRLAGGGIGEDGETKGVALIDFPGGL